MSWTSPLISPRVRPDVRSPPRDNLEKYSFAPYSASPPDPRPPLRAFTHRRPRPDLRYLGIRVVVVHVDRTLHALQIHRSSVSPCPHRHPPSSPSPSPPPPPPRRCQLLRFTRTTFLSQGVRHLTPHRGIIGPPPDSLCYAARGKRRLLSAEASRISAVADRLGRETIGRTISLGVSDRHLGFRILSLSLFKSHELMRDERRRVDPSAASRGLAWKTRSFAEFLPRG